MPSYDFRCRTCDAAFEVKRSIRDVTAPSCPQGHAETSRIFTPVAVSSSETGSRITAPAPAQQGCCGGGCCG